MVELNPRTTMGHVAIGLSRRLAPGVNAEFRIFTQAEWARHLDQLEKVPFVTSTDGHLKSGVLRLSEPIAESKLIPVLLIGNDVLDGLVKRS